MLAINLKTIRFASILIFAVMLCSVFVYPLLKGKSAPTDLKDTEKEMEMLKAEMEKPNSSPSLTKKYNRLAEILGTCSPSNQMMQETRIGNLLIPANNLCINGSLAVADPDYNRVLTNSTGTGIGTGVVGNCSLSGSGTAVNYDTYDFDLTSCAAFPTEITATLCGPAGCQHVGNTDTVLTLYRNVAAGDSLTANGGLAGVFNPASTCTNARGASDDIGSTAGAATNPGGATCNQVSGACLTPCTSPSNAGGLSGIRRQMGSGRFTLVISGFGNATTGGYNLYVNAPAAGCTVALAPSAANVTISGRALNINGSGIKNAVISLSGGSLPASITTQTNSFGYYSFGNLDVGQTYILTIRSKSNAFKNPTQVINLQDNAAGVDFISEQDY